MQEQHVVQDSETKSYYAGIRSAQAFSFLHAKQKVSHHEELLCHHVVFADVYLFLHVQYQITEGDFLYGVYTRKHTISNSPRISALLCTEPNFVKTVHTTYYKRAHFLRRPIYVESWKF